MKKSNIARALSIAAFLLCSLYSFAQQGNNNSNGNNIAVKIKDIALVPELRRDSLPDSTNFKGKIFFKLDLPAAASKVYLMFGTTKDAGDIMTITADVQHAANRHEIVLKGRANAIRNHTGFVPLEVPMSIVSSSEYVTVYVENMGGRVSNKLYYKLNP